MKQTFVYILTAILLMACSPSQKQPATAFLQESDSQLDYATGFSIATDSLYTTVTLFNPWKKGEVLERYYLVRDNSTEVPSNGHKIRIPLQSIAANSATQLEFLQMLDVLSCVTGVCNAQYIYNPAILKGVEDGRIQDMGDAFNLDIERLLLLRPDAVTTTAYNIEDENNKRMKQTGLHIIYITEWQERTLLGRAEWIKFFGAFFDKSARADSLFQEVKNNYNKLKQLTASCTNHPSVMAGQDFRGTWTMPSGNSFNAHLFRDAAATYHFADDNGEGSRFSSIEEALLLFKDADIWVGVQANSMDELAQTDSKYKLFKAFRNKQVYNYNKRINASGGNDYWESAVAHPDRLLKDMIKVFHPELLPDYETYYMQQLN